MGVTFHCVGRLKCQVRLCFHPSVWLLLACIVHVTGEEGLLTQALCLGSSCTQYFKIYIKHGLLLNFSAHNFPEKETLMSVVL